MIPFLISHTHNFFKKLYVILTQNINNREVFDDVVPHYQALSRAGQRKKGSSIPFFMFPAVNGIYMNSFCSLPVSINFQKR